MPASRASARRWRAFRPKAYAELIETSLKPRLVGGNPTDIQAHWRTMRRALSGRAGGMLFEAISGVDIALWDILGKVAGLPVHRLLGGMGRSGSACLCGFRELGQRRVHGP